MGKMKILLTILLWVILTINAQNQQPLEHAAKEKRSLSVNPIFTSVFQNGDPSASLTQNFFKGTRNDDTIILKNSETNSEVPHNEEILKSTPLILKSTNKFIYGLPRTEHPIPFGGYIIKNEYGVPTYSAPQWSLPSTADVTPLRGILQYNHPDLIKYQLPGVTLSTSFVHTNAVPKKSYEIPNNNEHLYFNYPLPNTKVAHNFLKFDPRETYGLPKNTENPIPFGVYQLKTETGVEIPNNNENVYFKYALPNTKVGENFLKFGPIETYGLPKNTENPIPFGGYELKTEIPNNNEKIHFEYALPNTKVADNFLKLEAKKPYASYEDKLPNIKASSKFEVPITPYDSTSSTQLHSSLQHSIDISAIPYLQPHVTTNGSPKITVSDHWIENNPQENYGVPKKNFNLASTQHDLANSKYYHAFLKNTASFNPNINLTPANVLPENFVAVPFTPGTLKTATDALQKNPVHEFFVEYKPEKGQPKRHIDIASFQTEGVVSVSIPLTPEKKIEQQHEEYGLPKLELPVPKRTKRSPISVEPEHFNLIPDSYWNRYYNDILDNKLEKETKEKIIDPEISEDSNEETSIENDVKVTRYSVPHKNYVVTITRTDRTDPPRKNNKHSNTDDSDSPNKHNIVFYVNGVKQNISPDFFMRKNNKLYSDATDVFSSDPLTMTSVDHINVNGQNYKVFQETSNQNVAYVKSRGLQRRSKRSISVNPIFASVFNNAEPSKHLANKFFEGASRDDHSWRTHQYAPNHYPYYSNKMPNSYWWRKAKNCELPFKGIAKPFKEYGLPSNYNFKPSESYGIPDLGTNKPDVNYGPPKFVVSTPFKDYGVPKAPLPKPYEFYEISYPEVNTPTINYGPPKFVVSKPFNNYGVPEAPLPNPHKVYGVPTHETDKTTLTKFTTVHASTPFKLITIPNQVTDRKPFLQYSLPKFVKDKPFIQYRDPKLPSIFHGTVQVPIINVDQSLEKNKLPNHNIVIPFNQNNPTKPYYDAHKPLFKFSNENKLPKSNIPNPFQNNGIGLSDTHHQANEVSTGHATLYEYNVGKIEDKTHKMDSFKYGLPNPYIRYSFRPSIDYIANAINPSTKQEKRLPKQVSSKPFSTQEPHRRFTIPKPLVSNLFHEVMTKQPEKFVLHGGQTSTYSLPHHTTLYKYNVERIADKVTKMEAFKYGLPKPDIKYSFKPSKHYILNANAINPPTKEDKRLPKLDYSKAFNTPEPHRQFTIPKPLISNSFHKVMAKQPNKVDVSHGGQTATYSFHTGQNKNQNIKLPKKQITSFQNHDSQIHGPQVTFAHPFRKNNILTTPETHRADIFIPTQHSLSVPIVKPSEYFQGFDSNPSISHTSVSIPQTHPVLGEVAKPTKQDSISSIQPKLPNLHAFSSLHDLRLPNQDMYATFYQYAVPNAPVLKTMTYTKPMVRPIKAEVSNKYMYAPIYHHTSPKHPQATSLPNDLPTALKENIEYNAKFSGKYLYKHKAGSIKTNNKIQNPPVPSETLQRKDDVKDIVASFFRNRTNKIKLFDTESSPSSQSYEYTVPTFPTDKPNAHNDHVNQHLTENNRFESDFLKLPKFPPKESFYTLNHNSIHNNNVPSTDPNGLLMPKLFKKYAFSVHKDTDSLPKPGNRKFSETHLNSDPIIKTPVKDIVATFFKNKKLHEKGSSVIAATKLPDAYKRPQMFNRSRTVSTPNRSRNITAYSVHSKKPDVTPEVVPDNSLHKNEEFTESYRSDIPVEQDSVPSKLAQNNIGLSSDTYNRGFYRHPNLRNLTSNEINKRLHARKNVTQLHNSTIPHTFITGNRAFILKSSKLQNTENNEYVSTNSPISVENELVNSDSTVDNNIVSYDNTLKDSEKRKVLLKVIKRPMYRKNHIVANMLNRDMVYEKSGETIVYERKTK